MIALRKLWIDHEVDHFDFITPGEMRFVVIVSGNVLSGPVIGVVSGDAVNLNLGTSEMRVVNVHLADFEASDHLMHSRSLVRRIVTETDISKDNLPASNSLAAIGRDAFNRT